MRDDSNHILDDLLLAWHEWAKGYQTVGDIAPSPMFRNAKSSRGWDTLDEIATESIDGATMESINFHVFEMGPEHRTSLQLHARNLATGVAVWSSPRLPQCPFARAALLTDAKGRLVKRLVAAGVI